MLWILRVVPRWGPLLVMVPVVPHLAVLLTHIFQDQPVIRMSPSPTSRLSHTCLTVTVQGLIGSGGPLAHGLILNVLVPLGHYSQRIVQEAPVIAEGLDGETSSNTCP